MAAIFVVLFGAATPAASAGTYNVLYNFDYAVGGCPEGKMVFDSAGNIYGADSCGGTYGFGAVFELSPPTVTGGAWTRTILYNFTGGSDGGTPYGGVTFDHAGNLYGTTYYGGVGICGCGTVFKLKPPATQGGVWSFRTMHVFKGGTSDGSGPYGPVTVDSAGNVYGATGSGGTYYTVGGSSGVVYKITPVGSGWTESVVWNFGGLGDGATPQTGLTRDSAGNYYGTTYFGGSNNTGTVFELTPPSGGGTAWTESVVHSFPLRAPQEAAIRRIPWSLIPPETCLEPPWGGDMRVAVRCSSSRHPPPDPNGPARRFIPSRLRPTATCPCT